ncbi:MAG: hypothetical protein E7168_03285 [Firmicutes bacterium]|nr:hypothetical protein [Bacillota bacterium]
MIPSIISVKDLNLLSDLFDKNLTILKQARHFEQEVNNEEVKELLDGIGNLHYHHLLYINKILKGEVKTSLGEYYDE